MEAKHKHLTDFMVRERELERAARLASKHTDYHWRDLFEHFFFDKPLAGKPRF